MEEITQYFKRKDRKTSSESSEGASPEEKRTKPNEFQAGNMPTPPVMAEDAEGLLLKLQLVLDKLVILETKVDSINKHVCSIDASVLQL